MTKVAEQRSSPSRGGLEKMGSEPPSVALIPVMRGASRRVQPAGRPHDHPRHAGELGPFRPALSVALVHPVGRGPPFETSRAIIHARSSHSCGGEPPRDTGRVSAIGIHLRRARKPLGAGSPSSRAAVHPLRAGEPSNCYIPSRSATVHPRRAGEPLHVSRAASRYSVQPHPAGEPHKPGDLHRASPDHPRHARDLSSHGRWPCRELVYLRHAGQPI